MFTIQNVLGRSDTHACKKVENVALLKTWSRRGCTSRYLMQEDDGGSSGPPFSLQNFRGLSACFICRDGRRESVRLLAKT